MVKFHMVKICMGKSAWANLFGNENHSHLDGEGMHPYRRTYLAPCIGSIWHYIVFHYRTPGFDCLSLSIDLDYRTIKTDWVLLSIAFDYQHCIIDSQLKYRYLLTV
jgi:hypothetical protein